MNTSKIKTYAIQARRDFLQAVTEKANAYGIFADDHIEPMDLKGDMAIIGDRAFPKKEGELRNKIVDRVKRSGFEMVMRSFAYTWFNRFVAIRYMEIHDYLSHGFRVLSNRNGLPMPEILENAADIEFTGLDKDTVIKLKLAGTKDSELYRLLILSQCDDLHRAMPFLFDRIDNEMELLFPDNLLHTDSPVRKLVTEIDEADWNDVEIIGWIYQFYISERKDEVIGKVVKSEDIPAATQLFTPNWIVKYMVQNTLGRMWLATYPESPLREKMEFYIEPAEQEPKVQEQINSITPKELTPEEITFLDPSCGSGHILVEAYDILKEIYLERGYRTKDIPRLILEKNLYGLDIDDRAAQLACFALLMRARMDNRRILKQDDFELNVMGIQESDESDLKNVEIFFKNDAKFKDNMKGIIRLFKYAKTVGSLITVRENILEKMGLLKTAIKENIDVLFRFSNVEHLKVLLRQAEILKRKYDCVVTNPPYMGKKGMNSTLKNFAKEEYPDSKSDLFAMFIDRCLQNTKKDGFVSLVTMEVWMFLSSYIKLRERLVSEKTLKNLVHNPYEGKKPTAMGINFGITAFTLFNQRIAGYKGAFSKLHYIDLNEDGTPKRISDITLNPLSPKPDDFKKIPGSPIAYWVGDGIRSVFEKGAGLRQLITIKQGMATSDNNRFLRSWPEVSYGNVAFDCQSLNESKTRKERWYPYNKGGDFRKWYGNNNFLVNWWKNGSQLKEFQSTLNQGWHVRLKSREYYFKPSITWTFVSSAYFGVRSSQPGFIFDVGGSSAFPDEKHIWFYTAYLCSKISYQFLTAVNPTLNFQVENIAMLPVLEHNTNSIVKKIDSISKNCIELSKADWDSYETSWDFTCSPLFNPKYYKKTLKETYKELITGWQEVVREMQRLEEENNRIFIESYFLHDEISPEVPLSEITLTCNPHYRYGGSKSEKEQELLMRKDIIKEFVSYAIGCMMGRYSLDHPGLIYAHSDNIDFDPSKYTTFPADDDGIIPIMDMDWFQDDATNRFVDFLKAAWSPETLQREPQVLLPTA